jgi:uncharacterized protein (TIGR00255 family)
MIVSMTGFASRIFTLGEETYKMELKSLNHRFLDLKVRIPRDLASFETPVKAALEAGIKRGSVDLWIERQSGAKNEGKSDSGFRVDEERARVAHASLESLRARLGLQEPVSLRDVISFPEVVVRASADDRDAAQLAALETRLLSELNQLIRDLTEMRKSEGRRLQEALLAIVAGFRESHAKFLGLRDEIRSRARERVKKRIEQCFEAYPTSDDRLRALMETRIAQEVSTVLDRLDVEEELTRFKGHIDAIEVLLTQGGAVGKKLDFLFQELNREINTLGNKSQDLGVSGEVIELKTRIEQMREQSLNLE